MARKMRDTKRHGLFRLWFTKASASILGCDHPDSCGMKYLPADIVICQLMVLATWCVRVSKLRMRYRTVTLRRNHPLCTEPLELLQQVMLGCRIRPAQRRASGGFILQRSEPTSSSFAINDISFSDLKIVAVFWTASDPVES